MRPHLKKQLVQNNKQEGWKVENNLQVIDQRELLGKDFKVYGDFENPLFLAKEVAEWIDYSRDSINKMLASIDNEEKVRKNVPTPGGIQEAWFLTEDGLYEVLMQSRKPIAKQFKKKVKEILKSIRRNGMYLAQAKAQEKMFNVMKIEMSNMLNEMVSEKMDAIDERCSKYFRPVSKEKQNIVNYIKSRLGIDKVDEDYELVKQRVLIKLGGEKWEDIPVETLVNSLNIIDESIRVIKADRAYDQVSFFEVAATK